MGEWSQVSARGITTRYQRYGNGQPVLLLIPAGGDATAASAVATKLSGRVRLLLPQLTPPLSDFPEWLGAFLDGLGINAVTIVVRGEFCASVLEFALEQPERIRGVVFVPEGDRQRLSLQGELRSTIGALSVPIIIARRDALELALIQIFPPA